MQIEGNIFRFPMYPIQNDPYLSRIWQLAQRLILSKSMQKIKNFFRSKAAKEKESLADKKLHRRSLEKHSSQLKMPYHYTGFTNRILIQQPDLKTINLFIPVYIIFKIKSIQDMDIQKLVGSISCVIIIQVLIQNLPEHILHLLETGMNIQINRSELVQLKDSQANNVSMTKTDRMLTFTLRKTVTGTIIEDTLWSPFEIVRLIVSITFNSIKKDGEDIAHAYYQHREREKQMHAERAELIMQSGHLSLPKKSKSSRSQRRKREIEFDSLKYYSISFNCMRNSDIIPISYALGCTYSLFDLAQRKLETYHTNLDSYNEVKRVFDEQVKPNKRKRKSPAISNVPVLAKTFSETYPQGQEEIQINPEKSANMIGQFLEHINTSKSGEDRDKQTTKAKYFQFTHFVIPMYKYPGNSLATIFIPIFLLALLSLGIFYQDNNLANRLGSIATMVLGYIALIPSIKEQLPPSAKVTFIECFIYISTLCCLFSLVESFMVDGIEGYVFQWRHNILFKICLFVHIAIFITILTLLAMHILVWQKSYNYDYEVKTSDPQKEKHAWINLYCDQQFFLVNDKIYKKNLKNDKEIFKSARMIKRYAPSYRRETERQVSNILQNVEAIGTFIQKKTSAEIKKKKKKQKQDKMQENEIESLLKPILGEAWDEDSENDKQQNQNNGPILYHELALNYLDQLISAGSHVTLPKGGKPQDMTLSKGGKLQEKKSTVEASKKAN